LARFPQGTAVLLFIDRLASFLCPASVIKRQIPTIEQNSYDYLVKMHSWNLFLGNGQASEKFCLSNSESPCKLLMLIIYSLSGDK
jgi:hypothetical protein